MAFNKFFPSRDKLVSYVLSRIFSSLLKKYKERARVLVACTIALLVLSLSPIRIVIMGAILFRLLFVYTRSKIGEDFVFVDRIKEDVSGVRRLAKSETIPIKEDYFGKPEIMEAEVKVVSRLSEPMIYEDYFAAAMDSEQREDGSQSDSEDDFVLVV